MIECSIEAEVGTQLTICRDSLRAEGEIVWRNDATAGIRFLAPLKIEEWVSIPTRTALAPEEHCSADREAPDELSNDVIDRRILDEVTFVSRSIEAVADLLTNDPILRIRHSNAIQQLCISSQMLEELTLVLPCKDKCSAVYESVTGPMRNRLLR